MIEVIGLAILGFMISDWFAPIQIIKDELAVYSWPYIGGALYCSKCCSFWLTLIVLHNIYLAAIAALISYIIKFVVNKIEEYYG